MKVPANVFLPQEEGPPSSPSHTDGKVAEACSLPQQESNPEEPRGGSSSNEVPEEHPGSPQEQEGTDEDEDEDDLPAQQQVFQHQEPADQPPAAVLTEVDEDGKETVISDHSTSAGFTFQNSLLYELD